MEHFEALEKPTKEEQRLATESYDTLTATLKELRSLNPEIEIEETKERVKVPLKVLKLLVEVLKAMSQGKPISIVPVASEMTTQAAAELLNCSRPHLVKLLENGSIPFTKVGRHRRVKYEDVVKYRKRIKAEQKQRIVKMMRADEELGLYDS